MSSASNPTKQSNVWLITGTSQGFGRELVRVALDRGDYVIATSRSPRKVTEDFPNNADRLLVIPLDLRDEEQIAVAIRSAVERVGRIDVLVNNAGHGLLGAIEEANDDEVKEIFETNVFGLLRVTRAVLPYMRQQRSGRIVNVSSIGGLTSTPGWGIYCSTKFAIEGLSEALAHEVAPLGIYVTIVEPGPFRTHFLGSSLPVASRQLPEYDLTAGRTRRWREERNGSQKGDPARGAEVIVEAVLSRSPPLHLLLGADAYVRANNKLDSLREEFEVWRELTVSTDFAAHP